MVDSVILTCKFTKEAVKQLRYDIQNGVFLLFDECHVNPRLFLGGLSSSLCLLEMSAGSARLLYETLVDIETSFEIQEAALGEMDINLRPAYVLSILKSRGDVM